MIIRTLLALGFCVVAVGCARHQPAPTKAEIHPEHIYAADEKQAVQSIGLLTVPQAPDATGNLDPSRTISSMLARQLKDKGYNVYTVTVERDATAQVDYASLGRKVDAYLDVRVLDAAYKAHGQKWGNARDFRPFVVVPVRLVSAKDGSVMYTFNVCSGDTDRLDDGYVQFSTEPKYNFRDERELARYSGYADEGLKATVQLAAMRVIDQIGEPLPAADTTHVAIAQ